MTCTCRLQTPSLRKSTSSKKKLSLTVNRKLIPPLRTLKKNSQHLILQQRFPPIFPKPYSVIRPHQSFIPFFQLNRHSFSSKIFPPLNTKDTLFKKNQGSLNPTVYLKKIKIKHILFIIQILSYILTYITSKKILSFSFCEYKLPYIFSHIVF